MKKILFTLIALLFITTTAQAQLFKSRDKKATKTEYNIGSVNRKILNGFYGMLGLSEKSGDIMRTVDKLEKIGKENVFAVLTIDLGLTAEQANTILDFIEISGTNEEILVALEKYRGKN